MAYVRDRTCTCDDYGQPRLPRRHDLNLTKGHTAPHPPFCQQSHYKLKIDMFPILYVQSQ